MKNPCRDSKRQRRMTAPPLPRHLHLPGGERLRGRLRPEPPQRERRSPRPLLLPLFLTLLSSFLTLLFTGTTGITRERHSPLSTPTHPGACLRAAASEWAGAGLVCGLTQPSLAANVKSTGLAQNSGQLQDSNRDFQSNLWANLKILGQSCEFRVAGKTKRLDGGVYDGDFVDGSRRDQRGPAPLPMRSCRLIIATRASLAQARPRPLHQHRRGRLQIHVRPLVARLVAAPPLRPCRPWSLVPVRGPWARAAGGLAEKREALSSV